MSMKSRTGQFPSSVLFLFLIYFVELPTSFGRAGKSHKSDVPPCTVSYAKEIGGENWVQVLKLHTG